MTPVVKTEALSKWYGRIPGIHGVDLEVGEGEIFGFLGPNGAGKTTTIRILTGFLRPSAGRALVFGMDCWKQTTKVKARIGFLPDAPSLYPSLTGVEFLDYLTRLDKNRAPKRRQIVCDRLELSRADLSRKIKGYSMGMSQKLAIIQAFQHDPDLLIMDEPTASLDPLIQQALFQLLTDFRSRGRTVFVSSHNLSEVERLCNRVAIIRQGSLAAVEDVETLRKQTPRRLELVLANDMPEGRLHLDGVVSSVRKGRRLSLMVRGDVNRIVEELSRLELEDLVLEQPRLEDIFLSYYRSDDKRA